jgi:hypothetical protein
MRIYNMLRKVMYPIYKDKGKKQTKKQMVLKGYYERS